MNRNKREISENLISVFMSTNQWSVVSKVNPHSLRDTLKVIYLIELIPNNYKKLDNQLQRI